MSGNTSAYPLDTVVLISDVIGGEAFHGSGVLIASDEVLTASHILYHEGVGTATSLEVSPGFNGGPGRSYAQSAPFGTATVPWFHYIQINDAGNFIPYADSQFDYAVLHISPGFARLGAMALQPDFRGGTANQTGYPGSSGVQTTVTRTFFDDSWNTVLDGQGLPPGSSGGPVWIQNGGTAAVVGIASSLSSDYSTGTFVQITRQAVQQIDAWLAQDGAGAQSGAIATARPTNSARDDRAPVAFGQAGAIVVDDGSTLYVQGVSSGQPAAVSLASTVRFVEFSDGAAADVDPTGVSERVARLYSTAFGRLPDLSGLMSWSDYVQYGGLTLSQVADGFAASSEFAARYGSPSDAAFVDDLYHSIRGQSGDAADMRFWTDQLAHGATRGSVLVDFAESPENVSSTMTFVGDAHLSEAYRLYAAVLDRPPEAAGLTGWTGALNQGASLADVAGRFLGSQEFMQRNGSLSDTAFVDLLYHNAFGRAGEAQGVQAWTQRLAGGASRAQVALGFSESFEARVDTAASTHDGWTLVGG